MLLPNSDIALQLFRSLRLIAKRKVNVDSSSAEKILSLTFSVEDRRILFGQEEFRKAAAKMETEDDILKVIELGANIIRRLAKDNKL